jgi:glycolate oxidase
MQAVEGDELRQVGLVEALAAIVGQANVHTGEAISPDFTHDEALVAHPVVPLAVVSPSSTGEVAEIVGVARRFGVPLTPRGSASGLSGACVAVPGGLLVSFTRMNRLLELDLENQVAVVQPGITLHQLDEELRPHGLAYTVYPGELSASVGGNVATNAGGMRAVRYGVTRHNVLGLEMVLGTGEIVRSGGKFVKSSTGYDLTQLVIGSEGTLALVTEATLKLQPVLRHSVTVLAPYRSLPEVTSAIPAIVGSGLQPTILEYIDALTMASITRSENIDLGIPHEVSEEANAYLVVVVEHRTAARIDEDIAFLGELLVEHGATDVYVLPGPAAASLIVARERAFYVAKAAGANEIVDVVVPRARIADFLESVGKLAAQRGCFAVGCGHAGDGNIHLSVFQSDQAVLEEFLVDLFRTGISLGGAISGEHGIGTAKRDAYLTLEDPSRLTLMRRLKEAFDPDGILNPDKVFGPSPPPKHADKHLHSHSHSHD